MSVKESREDRIERLLGGDARCEYECKVSQLKRARYALNKRFDAMMLLAEYEESEGNGVQVEQD